MCDELSGTDSTLIRSLAKQRQNSPAKDKRTPPEKKASWTAVITAVKTPLGLFALIVMVSEAMLGVTCALIPAGSRMTVVIIMVALFGLVILSVTIISLVNPVALSKARSVTGTDRKVEVRPDEEKRHLIEVNKGAVQGADAPPLSSDNWAKQMQQLRPLLHQASRYSMPTYYLDTDLNIIDWNVAFDLIFKRVLHRIRCRHVNYLIAELANCEQVFDHARDFTQKVALGELPLIDLEPLVYNSDAYGVVEFEKVACQLTDAEANLKAWAVGLMVKQIDWDGFNSDLLLRLREHKLWSIYAVSYDTILLGFPPYRDLINEVIQGVDRDAKHVLDLGAGTGNVTSALLNRNHRVTAIENNQPMLEKLLVKKLDRTGRLTINKNSLDDLDSLKDETFDAVVAVNVLYALDDPSGCIRNVARILKPGGVFALSTTHSETELDPLLQAIKQKLIADKEFDSKEEHYRRVYGINKDIEITIAKRHTREEYEEWLRVAGFEVFYNNPSTYVDAVMAIHARKRSE